MEGKESAIVFATWAIVFATLLGPILAVQVQKVIERIKERHSRKTWVFQTLMATRGQRVAPNHVQALNMIDLAFYGARRLGLHHRTKSEQSVIDAWHEYLRHLNHGPQEPTEANMTSWGASGNELFYNLLFAVAVNVGYNSHSAPFFTALKQFWKSLPLRRRMSDTQLISWPQPLVSTYNFP